MKLNFKKRKNAGLTLIEVIVVIFLLMLLAATLLPESGGHRVAMRISCVNNLKQLGLAYHLWAGDNNDKYPFQISVTNGGAMELINTPDAWKTFQVMSNELSIPKVIRCPEDSTHETYATNFGDDLKNKISYFIGLDSGTNSPQALLSGDDNFLRNHMPVKSGMANITAGLPVEWDATRHGRVSRQVWFIKTKVGSGNILLADGSVQVLSQSGLTNQISQTGLITNRLVIP